MSGAFHIGVLGAGSIGCYIGGRIVQGGLGRVTLVGRPRTGAALARDGLHLTGLRGPPTHLPLSDALRFAESVEALADCDAVLLCTKGRDSEGAAAAMAAHLRPGAAVASLQNGVRNAERIRTGLGRRAGDVTVLRGMVSFNVVWTDSRFHQGTTGPVLLDPGPAAARLVAAMRAGGLDASTHADMVGIQWGKLLFNLNNAVNALSGLPLRAQLQQRPHRRLLADVITEAQAVLRANDIQPRALGKMNPTLARYVLPLPDWLFFRVASAMLKIDAEARSSMQDDLLRGRPTEIDDINGEIAQLGGADGAPLSSRIVRLVRQAEAAGQGPPGLSAAQIRSPS